MELLWKKTNYTRREIIVSKFEIYPFEIAILVIRSNKHCLKKFSDLVDSEKLEKYYIMDRYSMSGFFSNTFFAHTGTDGLPVIDQKIVSYNYLFGVFDFKLIALEYNLLIEHFNIHPFRSRKQIQYRLRKEYGFRYIK